MRLLLHATENYFKYEEELDVLLRMALTDWQIHEFVKSGYLYGEVTAIVLWGKDIETLNE